MTSLRELPKKVDELGLQIVQLRDEIRSEFSAMRAEVHASDEETLRSLREEIRAGDEDTRRQMRVLHEDVIGRLGLLQEGLPPSRRKSRRKT